MIGRWRRKRRIAKRQEKIESGADSVFAFLGDVGDLLILLSLLDD